MKMSKKPSAPVDGRGTKARSETDLQANDTTKQELTQEIPVPIVAPDVFQKTMLVNDSQIIERTMLTNSPDDAGNAMCVHFLHGGMFRFCPSVGWMAYNGGFWETANAEARVVIAVRDTLIKRRVLAVKHDKESLARAAKPSSRSIKSCIYQFRALVESSIAEFDKSPDLLNCANGVVDLRTGELTPHSAEQMFTYCLSVDYDPDADSDEWLGFLHGATGNNQAVVDYLQRCVGYSLTGSTREEILFYLHGPTRSGKGIFSETILALMGRPLSTEIDFGVFTAKRDVDSQNFALAPLKPTRFVAASESSKYERLNSAKTKAVTGGNFIYCAHKQKPHFSYRPQFKIWLSSNHPVNGDPDDQALWARIRVVEFPNSFLGKEDKNLKYKLRQPATLAGLLAWAVAGAIAWYKSSDGLAAPKTIVDATKKAQDDLDYVGQWLDEKMDVTGNPDDFVLNSILYTSYKEWCQNMGVQEKKQTGLTQSLKLKGFAAGVPKKIQGKTHRVCKGVKIKLLSF